MELDAARNRARNIPSDVCRQCKQPGHWAKDCTTRFDIRQMQAEIDELEEMVALRKDLLELHAKEEQASGPQGEVAEMDPGFGFASE